MLKSMALEPARRRRRLLAARHHRRRDRAPAGSCGLSYPDYQYLRDHDRAFTGLVGIRAGDTSTSAAAAARARSAPSSSRGNYFQVLGVRAARGRTLLPSDEIAPGRHPVVVISDGLWRRDFAADPDIVGKTIEINNYPLTVVGVADPRSTARSSATTSRCSCR